MVLRVKASAHMEEALCVWHVSARVRGGQSEQRETTYTCVLPVVHLGRNQGQEAIEGLCMVAEAILGQGDKDQWANLRFRRAGVKPALTCNVASAIFVTGASVSEDNGASQMQSKDGGGDTLRALNSPVEGGRRQLSEEN